MPAKESFDIDGLMVFRGDLTAVDPDGNTVASVTTPDKYVPSLKEPLSGEQIGRYTKTTAYWREHSTYVPLKGDVIIYSDGGSITEGGVTVYVPKMKVGDGVTTVGNLLFTDSDNQGGAAGTLYEAVTYSQLVTKINNSQLVKGKKYRITDYVTTTTQTNTSSAGHAFDLVVTAINVNKLDCMASALLHSGDTYFSTAGADLSKWQIWYDVNNDTTKYDWADTTNGKGVIYRMIDEWRNDCPYDFKNILFTRKLEEHGVIDEENGTDTLVYTFNIQTNGNQTDASLIGQRVFDNYMASNSFYSARMDFDYVSDGVILLNDNVFLLNNYFYITQAYSNKILDNCSCNTFMGFVCCNVLHGYNFWNTFWQEAQDNQVMSWVHDNDFGNEFNNNYIGCGCSCIKTDGRFCYNHIDGGNRYIYFKKGENDNGILKNIYLTPNTYTSYGSYTIIDSITTDRNYRTTVGRDSSGNIRIYNEDDPASGVTIYSGSTAPSSAIGVDGDIYIQEV